MIDLPNAALDLASRGFEVFPLNGKHPRISKEDGGRGCHDATSDPVIVAAWWDRWPDAGIGIHCGPGSGIWVLDVDAGKPGINVLSEIEAELGRLDTYRVATGGGGYHYYWRWPEGRTIRNHVAARIEGVRIEGLDVRAHGGYVVAPPSPHPSGRTYVVDVDAPIAAAPGWLLDLVAPPEVPRPAYRPPVEPAGDLEARRVRGMIRRRCERIAGMVSGRIPELFNAARSLAGFAVSGGVPTSEIEAALYDAAVACGAVEKHGNDARKAIVNGIANGAAAPRPLPPDTRPSMLPRVPRSQDPDLGPEAPWPDAPPDVEPQAHQAPVAEETAWEHLSRLARAVVAAPKSDPTPRKALTSGIRWDDLVVDTLDDPAAWDEWLLGCPLSGVEQTKLSKVFRVRLEKAQEQRDIARRDAAARAKVEIEAAKRANPNPDGPEWDVLDRLQRTAPAVGEPKIKANDYNLGTILTFDSRWKDRVRLNLFWDGPEILDTSGRWRGMEDRDLYDLCRWVAGTYQLDYHPEAAMQQLDRRAGEVPVHPVRAYLASLRWDGVDRVNVLLSRYFGVEPSDLAGRVGTAWLISLVARVAPPKSGCNASGGPGCKVDTMLVLTGKQGRYKSSTLAAMMPDPRWFSDSKLLIHQTPNIYESMRGNWLYEIAEFDSFRRAEAGEIKAFISSAVDRYRRSFGRMVVTQPRQNVPVATLNPREFLDDPTGARRFWPFEVEYPCRPELMAAERDQLWAQAYELYLAGDQWWFGDELAAELAANADQYSIVDTWQPRIADYLEGRYPDAIARRKNEVTVNDILENAVMMPVREQNSAESKRVRDVLQRLGWEPGPRADRARNVGPRVWRRPEIPPTGPVGGPVSR